MSCTLPLPASVLLILAKKVYEEVWNFHIKKKSTDKQAVELCCLQQKPPQWLWSGEPRTLHWVLPGPSHRVWRQACPPPKFALGPVAWQLAKQPTSSRLGDVLRAKCAFDLQS